MAEPEMASVLWGQGQRQPQNTAGGQWVSIQKRLTASMWGNTPLSGVLCHPQVQ